ncbi:uncharacterized protein LOC144453054 [Glandiceps talaboti]
MGTNMTKCTSPNNEAATKKYKSQSEIKETKQPISGKAKMKKHSNGKLQSSTENDKPTKNESKPKQESKRRKSDKKSKKTKSKKGEKCEPSKTPDKLNDKAAESTSDLPVKSEVKEVSVISDKQRPPSEDILIKTETTQLIPTKDVENDVNKRDDNVELSEEMRVEQMNLANTGKLNEEEPSEFETAPSIRSDSTMIVEGSIVKCEEELMESIDLANTQSLVDAVLSAGSDKYMVNEEKIEQFQEPIVEKITQADMYSSNQTPPSMVNDEQTGKANDEELETLRQRIADMEQERLKFENENKELKAACSEMKENLQKISEKLEGEQKLNSENQKTLKDELESKNEAITVMKSEMKLLEKELDDKTDLITKQQSEIDRLRDLSTSYATMNEILDQELIYKEEQLAVFEKVNKTVASPHDDKEN